MNALNFAQKMDVKSSCLIFSCFWSVKNYSQKILTRRIFESTYLKPKFLRVFLVARRINTDIRSKKS
jgi:hypothetical protein